MQVTVELPDHVAHQLGSTPAAVAHQMIESAAIESYRVGRLSHRQVGELLGLDYWSTENFLRERNVWLNYSGVELEADHAALDTILGPS